jgi:hypothetical protein
MNPPVEKIRLVTNSYLYCIINKKDRNEAILSRFTYTLAERAFRQMV